jgi:hypothetical protein
MFKKLNFILKISNIDTCSSRAKNPVKSGVNKIIKYNEKFFLSSLYMVNTNKNLLYLFIY